MQGISSLLNIGQKGLFASQVSLETTGNNIANANTEGYHRRTTRLDESMSIDSSVGQIGTGVDAVEVYRHFDAFVESSFNDKSANMNRWDTLNTNLQGIESIYDESTGGGLNEALSQFFSDWQDLSKHPDTYSSREAMLADAQNFIAIIKSMDTQMERLQEQANQFIDQDVDKVNQILGRIAEINKQISSHDIPGSNNANELYDDRDLLVRELAEKIDVNVIDNGGGNYTLTTDAGHTLVDGQKAYSLSFETSKSFNTPSGTSNFDGSIYYEGSDEYEYHFEVVQAGDVSNGNSAAMLRVSLDGGKSYLKDEDGSELLIAARPGDQKISVGSLKIWFGQEGDSDTAPTTNMSVGDTFSIVPKQGLYWNQNSAGAVNVTPQNYSNGLQNEQRITGGSLAGLFNFRDDYVGRYRDKLDSFAKALTWEVNRIHSEGAGLEHHSLATGTYSVDNDNVALGSDASGLTFRSELQAGGANLYVYDSASNSLVSNAALDFDPATPGQQNFDPAVHSITDVANAINNSFPGMLSASVVNHRLQIEAQDGYEFEFGADTTGMYAALGLNTFFEGDDARTLALNESMSADLSHMNTGHVNGAGEANSGDNTTASRVGELQTKQISLTTLHQGTVVDDLTGFYNSLVADVGADTENTNFHYEYQKALADDLDKRQQSVSGVNLDEEMSSLVKFQHAYTAAAKLITTADQMIQTLLSLKQ